MHFRKAQKNDVDAIAALYAQAVAYFAQSGIDQWQHGYPNAESAEADIAAENSYLLENEDGVLATAMFCIGHEPTYDHIYDGSWAVDGPYAFIHRVAVSNDQKGKGVAQVLFNKFDLMCKLKNIKSLRVDTHEQNRSMQRALTKNGFECRGIIYLADGSKRLAFEKAV